MKKHKPFSKVVTFFIVLLAYVFVIFACYEMHRLNNLEPIAYIGSGIVLLLGVTVKAYMRRAAQQDLVDNKVRQAKELSEVKKEYGDNYVSEDMPEASIDDYSDYQ